MSGERLDPMLGHARADVRLRMSRGGSVDDVDAEIIDAIGVQRRREGGSVALRVVVRAAPDAAKVGRPPPRDGGVTAGLTLRSH